MADQGTEGVLSPFLRKMRFKAAKPYLYGRILDMGCGSGALAELVDAELYMGVEMDEISLQLAKKLHPLHHFVKNLSKVKKQFDTVVTLAVIEHVADPAFFLRDIKKFLIDAPTSRIVVTTPHPSVDVVHKWGGKFGIFSRHANEEHEDLLDKCKLSDAGEQAGLVMIDYKRFLFRANQLAVFKVR